MKKLLLATSILAGTAGLASAEITLTGDARMGLFNDFVGAGADDTVFSSRARVTFTMTGSTDSGLEFGASFRADNAGGASSGTAGSVYVSGAFGKLSMGDVDGAAAAALGQVDGVGYTGLGDTNELVYIGNGGVDGLVLDTGAAGGFIGDYVMTGDPSVLYEYSTGAVSVYVGINQLGTSWVVNPGAGAVDFMSDGMSVGLSYTLDGYKFGIGYERIDTSSVATIAGGEWTTDQISLGADATFGAITVKARYAKGGTDGNAATGNYVQDHDQWALSATYTADALAVTGFASHKQFTDGAGVNKAEFSAMGLGASYDLGGGAAVKGGVAQLEETLGGGAPVKDTAFDLGLTFTF